MGITEREPRTRCHRVRRTVFGLRFIPTNGDATAPGCLCEGWGVANADETTGTFSGYANISSDGRRGQGLVVQPGTGVTAPTGHAQAGVGGGAFKSVVTTSNGRLRITHSFHSTLAVPQPLPGRRHDREHRRRRRLAISDTEGDGLGHPANHVPGMGRDPRRNAANVLRATTDGFGSANPFRVPPGSGSPPTTLVPGSVTTSAVRVIRGRCSISLSEPSRPGGPAPSGSTTARPQTGRRPRRHRLRRGRGLFARPAPPKRLRPAGRRRRPPRVHLRVQWRRRRRAGELGAGGGQQDGERRRRTRLCRSRSAGATRKRPQRTSSGR